jgi:hypothetical protein
LELES